MGQAIGAVRLADGTRVAYASSGGGPPLLFVPGWVSHLELGWALAPERRFYEGLSQALPGQDARPLRPPRLRPLGRGARS